MKRIIRLYYGFQFFFSLLIWLPIFYEYQKRIGLSDSEIFNIQSIYYLAFCFMEIPTGLVADRWGYRNCLRLGALLLVISNLLPIFVASYSGFLFHFLLIALSRSFISGASSAYVYEYLSHQNSAVEYKRIEGKARAYGLLGKVICWSAVGALMQWHLTLPYWLTILAAVISVGFAMALPEVHKAQQPIDANLDATLTANDPIKQTLLTLRILFTQPFLIFIMFQGVAIFVLGRICQVNLFQPILESKSFPVVSYGLVMSGMTVLEAVGSAYPHWIRRFSADLNAVFILTAAMAVTLALIPFSGSFGVVVNLCLFSLAAGFSFPIQRQLLNDAIPDSKYRATLLSMESILDRAVCAWVATLLASSLGDGLLNRFIVVASAVTLGFILMLLLVYRFFNRPKLSYQEVK